MSIMSAVCAYCTHERCLFRSAAAKEALGVGQSEWVVEQCTVSEDGRPSCCTGQLQVLSTAKICGGVHVLSAIGPAHQQCRQQIFHKADIEILSFFVLMLIAGHKRMPHALRASLPTLSPIESKTHVLYS